MRRISIQLPTRTLLVLALSVPAFNGCSFSESSSASLESVSGIVSIPFESSSASFPAKDEKYEEEISAHTEAFAGSSTADYVSFRKGLSEIAEKHGITNWEVQPLTYNAIGRGLKKAGLKGVEYETLKKNLGAGEFTKIQDIEKGYQAED
ncbi:MAG: putative lipoprotein [Methylococcales bacterium]